MTTSSNKDKGVVKNGGKWECGYCGEFGYGRDFMEKHKCQSKSMTTSSKTNNMTTTLDKIKEEFEIVLNNNIEAGCIAYKNVKENVWQFISQQISIAEERERERIIKEALTSTCDPARLLVHVNTLKELLSHKSTKEK